MLPNVELPIYPSSINCLAWSNDGELAVAASDTVHILIPRRDYGQHSRHAFNMDPWLRISFKVNSFTSTEWPPHELAQLEELSIGEEQSPNTIVSLSWSPLGLAKHKRSALAILTTGHILSLWASDSDLRVVSTWKRVLILNKALQLTPEDNAPSEGVASGWGISRRSSRIRSMSWAPVDADHNHQACQSQYLTVTNDADEVVVLHIQSPWSNDGHVWEVQVMDTAGWETLMEISNTAERNTISPGRDFSSRLDQERQWSSLFASCVAKKTFIDQVTCVPSSTPQSVFGLILRKNEQTLRFELLADSFPRKSIAGHWMPLSHCQQPFSRHVHFQSFSCGAAVSIGKMPSSPSYIAIANNDSDIELLSCKPAETVTDYPHALSDSKPTPKILSLVDEWDEISGMAFVSISTGALILQASGLLSGPFAIRILSDLSGDGEIYVPYRSALHTQALTLQKEFDQHHDLGGLSFTKTWGLASWGPYAASCITMHPGDMVEYSLISEQRCHILFIKEGISEDLQEDTIFPWQDISNDMHRQTSPAVLEKILSVLDKTAAQHKIAGTRIIYNVCCAAMACSDMQQWHLVERLLHYLFTLNEISYDAELGLLHSIRDSQLSTPECAAGMNDIARAKIEQHDYFMPNLLYNFCSICNQMIVWRSLNEAHCISGHQFARCGLTFLPITEPGISKSCESCHREYLDPVQIAQIVRNDSTDLADHTTAYAPNMDPSHTTADTNDEMGLKEQQPPADDEGNRVLSSSLNLINEISQYFDVCPYCQGKYIG